MNFLAGRSVARDTVSNRYRVAVEMLVGRWDVGGNFALKRVGQMVGTGQREVVGCWVGSPLFKQQLGAYCLYHHSSLLTFANAILTCIIAKTVEHAATINARILLTLRLTGNTGFYGLDTTVCRKWYFLSLFAYFTV